MIDLSWAVQKGIFAALASAGVVVVDGVQLDGDVPSDQVYFGDDPVQEIGGKGSRLERHDFTIQVMTAGASRKPMRDKQEAIRAALHEQPISCDGAILSPPALQTTNGQQIDGATFLGSQTFLVFAQPAD